MRVFTKNMRFFKNIVIGSQLTENIKTIMTRKPVEEIISDIKQEVRKVFPTVLPALILDESGTGVSKRQN